MNIVRVGDRIRLKLGQLLPPIRPRALYIVEDIVDSGRLASLKSVSEPISLYAATRDLIYGFEVVDDLTVTPYTARLAEITAAASQPVQQLNVGDRIQLRTDGVPLFDGMRPGDIYFIVGNSSLPGMTVIRSGDDNHIEIPVLFRGIVESCDVSYPLATGWTPWIPIRPRQVAEPAAVQLPVVPRPVTPPPVAPEENTAVDDRLREGILIRLRPDVLRSNNGMQPRRNYIISEINGDNYTVRQGYQTRVAYTVSRNFIETNCEQSLGGIDWRACRPTTTPPVDTTDSRPDDDDEDSEGDTISVEDIRPGGFIQKMRGATAPRFLYSEETYRISRVNSLSIIVIKSNSTHPIRVSSDQLVGECRYRHTIGGRWKTIVGRRNNANETEDRQTEEPEKQVEPTIITVNQRRRRFT
jgi:hypothetical protein